MIKNIVKTVTIGALFVGSVAFAQESGATSDTSIETQSAQSVISEGQMVDMAGKQRMLSQRMAKDYFYAGKKINKSNANRQLKTTLADFKSTQKLLTDNIKDEEITNLIAFVDMSLDEFISISKEDYSVDNGTIILDLSESMLEGSNYIVQALAKGKSSNEIIDMAGKQRMLSQRIGKYYIAYQAGIRDDNTVTQMKETVKEFDTALNKLINSEGNTPQIQKELLRVNKMWKIVYKFYLNIEKGGLPIIVFSTTDDITSKMNKIVAMYVKVLEK
ncbi:MAG: type IV pili methyl-accepting chemotaxis transducer N-terminal domain-containing protein [Campylobacterota bacterium]|nr:type IV pili methyl-accepting chemotaxis transducer N-terminal domain-containing protein [Campylobacterota bacterium]